MLIVNKIQLYNFDKNLPESDTLNIGSINFEFVGNQYSTIACFFHSDTPLLESKDYKLLTKVFEKLNWRVDNLLIINTKSCVSTDFNSILKKFKIKSIFFFGENHLTQSLPFSIAVNQSVDYQKIKIFKTDSLNTIATSDDIQYKKLCWDSIRNFFQKINS